MTRIGQDCLKLDKMCQYRFITNKFEWSTTKKNNAVTIINDVIKCDSDSYVGVLLKPALNFMGLNRVKLKLIKMKFCTLHICELSVI